MKITVIGCGRWGSFIAWYLDKTGHGVSLYGREGSPHMKQFRESRTNGIVTLPNSIRLISAMEEAVKAELIVVSVGAQSFREVAADIAAQGYRGDLVLCMKGIEQGSGKRLSEIALEYLPKSGVAVWLGPGHVQEFVAGIPNCMVIDGTSEELKERLVTQFSSSLIRFYYGRDLIGNEVGAAAKNVIGIAAGSATWGTIRPLCFPSSAITAPSARPSPGGRSSGSLPRDTIPWRRSWSFRKSTGWICPYPAPCIKCCTTAQTRRTSSPPFSCAA